MIKLPQAALIVGITLVTIAATSGVGHAETQVTNTIQSHTLKRGEKIMKLCAEAKLCKPGDVITLTSSEPPAVLMNDTRYNITSFNYKMDSGQDAVWSPAISDVFNDIQTSPDGKTQTLGGGNWLPGTVTFFNKQSTTTTKVTYAVSFDGTAVPRALF